MLYYDKPLFEIRYPSNEDHFMDILKMLAIFDSTYQIQGLVNAFKLPELNVDAFDPEKLGEEYFKFNRPDIILLNPDTLSTEYLKNLTFLAHKYADKMPLIVTVSNLPERSHRLGSIYSAHIHIPLPVVPYRDAAFLEHYFVSKVISKEYYIEKLRKMVQITLKAMHCKEKSAGFRYLTDAVTLIISHPYHFYGTTHSISKRIAKMNGVSTANIHSCLSNTISQAIHEMSDAEYNAAFGEYDDIDDIPNHMQFMHAAATLASRPAWDIIMNLHREPFDYLDRKINFNRTVRTLDTFIID